MPHFHELHQSPAARRFGQIGIVALAALGTSAAGLLAYINQPYGPSWLRWVVLASAVVVIVSLTGWLIATITELARRRLNRFRRIPTNTIRAPSLWERGEAKPDRNFPTHHSPL